MRDEGHGQRAADHRDRKRPHADDGVDVRIEPERPHPSSSCQTPCCRLPRVPRVKLGPAEQIPHARHSCALDQLSGSAFWLT
jgi:hypothetical protein